MDLIDRLREISTRIPKLKQDDLIKTEEGTKNALVMPFINALGYNVFDPTEVTPELNADFGVKKGEKVDYAILRDGKPIILFECKSLGTNLQIVHASQLYRYFSVTSVRFGILTDGVQYRFYSDLAKTNTMDEEPFFVFDLTEIKESAVEELKKFTKSVFNEESILTAASELKYKNLVRIYLSDQIQTPSDDLIKVLMSGSNAFTGRYTQAMYDSFRPIVRDAFRSFINEQVENRLKSALANETATVKAEAAAEPPTVPVPAITTTQDEIDAYYIIKAILREIVDPQRIIMRDVQSYCGILLDNNRQQIARVYFGVKSKWIAISNGSKLEQKHEIGSVDDIYKYANEMKQAVKHYLGEPVKEVNSV